MDWASLVAYVHSAAVSSAASLSADKALLLNQPAAKALATAAHHSIAHAEDTASVPQFVDTLPPEAAQIAMQYLPQKDLVSVTERSERYDTATDKEAAARRDALLAQYPLVKDEQELAYLLAGTFLRAMQQVSRAETMLKMHGEDDETIALVDQTWKDFGDQVIKVEDAAYFLPASTWVRAIAEHLDLLTTGMVWIEPFLMREGGVASLLDTLSPYYGLNKLLCAPVGFQRVPLYQNKPVPRSLLEWAQIVQQVAHDRQSAIAQMAAEHNIQCAQ